VDHWIFRLNERTHRNGIEREREREKRRRLVVSKEHQHLMDE
jgi:hypothetical protein